MIYKVTETDSHIFFLTGPLSNWHPMLFHGKLVEDGPVLRFNRREQYMMAAKGTLFGDKERVQKILESNDPSEQKKIGRAVGGFTAETWERDAAPIWNEHCRDIVFRACWFSAQYHEEYRSILVNSGDKTLVEGSIQDRVWGVGMAWDDPTILNEDNWKGTNYLGECHMRTRWHLRCADESFNPWLPQKWE